MSMKLSEEIGYYQWVGPEQLAKFEADGWKVVARQTRFHWDSYLMFKPSEPCSKTEEGHT